MVARTGWLRVRFDYWLPLGWFNAVREAVGILFDRGLYGPATPSPRIQLTSDATRSTSSWSGSWTPTSPPCRRKDAVRVLASLLSDPCWIIPPAERRHALRTKERTLP